MVLLFAKIANMISFLSRCNCAISPLRTRSMRLFRRCCWFFCAHVHESGGKPLGPLPVNHLLHDMGFRNLWTNPCAWTDELPQSPESTPVSTLDVWFFSPRDSGPCLLSPLTSKPPKRWGVSRILPWQARFCQETSILVDRINSTITEDEKRLGLGRDSSLGRSNKNNQLLHWPLLVGGFKHGFYFP